MVDFPNFRYSEIHEKQKSIYLTLKWYINQDITILKLKI